ncbi:MAG: hypothetical protein KGQ32_05835, partial [Xanthomonadaceae bacterium]|nr:hypothetical protein [Xanthomonadaceae bacterium]
VKHCTSLVDSRPAHAKSRIKRGWPSDPNNRREDNAESAFAGDPLHPCSIDATRINATGTGLCMIIPR